MSRLNRLKFSKWVIALINAGLTHGEDPDLLALVYAVKDKLYDPNNPNWVSLGNLQETIKDQKLRLKEAQAHLLLLRKGLADPTPEYLDKINDILDGGQ